MFAVFSNVRRHREPWMLGHIHGCMRHGAFKWAPPHLKINKHDGIHLRYEFLIKCALAYLFEEISVYF